MVELVWIPLVLQAVVPTRTSRTCTSTRKGPAPEARPSAAIRSRFGSTGATS